MSTDFNPSEVAQEVETVAIAPPPPGAPPIPSNDDDDLDDDDDSSSSSGKARLSPPEGGFTEIPSEWNKRDYAPLRKADFANPMHYHLWKIQEYKKQIASHEEIIELIRIYGFDEVAIKKARADKRTLANAKELVQSRQLPNDILIEMFGGVDQLESLLAMVKGGGQGASTEQAPPQV